MSELTTIHHLAINVANLEKSIQWYRTSFNCELISQEKTEAVLQFANLRLVLVLPSQEPGHAAYGKDNAEAFGELRKRSDGVESTFVADPTGNVVEIVKYPVR